VSRVIPPIFRRQLLAPEVCAVGVTELELRLSRERLELQLQPLAMQAIVGIEKAEEAPARTLHAVVAGGRNPRVRLGYEDHRRSEARHLAFGTVAGAVVDHDDLVRGCGLLHHALDR